MIEVLALLGMAAGAAAFVYYCRQLGKLNRLLTRIENQEFAGLDRTKETQESKLEHRLYKILHQASRDEQKAAKERDDVSALLSDLSHQLKTPLANVVMYAELLEEADLQPGQRTEFARQTRQQAEKMQWLLKTMLKASQLEQGSVAFSAEYTGIKATIGMAVGGIFARANEKGITIVTEEFSDRKLYHNPRWTAEALDNILDNAVKYSPENSRITIRLYTMEIYTRIEICDQGIGIDASAYNDIFKRFYRAENVSGTEGSGLGLYLAQLILQKEKGYITVASQPGGGSCFRVHLLNMTKL